VLNRLLCDTSVEGERYINSWISYFSFGSDMVVNYEEYYIYNLNTIVASIGGGLGMFLGVSIFGTVSKMMNPCVKREKVTADQKKDLLNHNP